MHRHLAGLTLAVVMVLASVIRPPSAAAHQLCFPADKTPHCLNDPFADYWEDNGGLPVFGYPITTAAPEANADTGQTYLTQWVERTRMEEHPENQPPYQVLLGLLGKERLRQLGRDVATEPRESGPKDGCLWFDQTGHNVCNIAGNLGFRQYWESHGLTIPGLSTFDRSLQLFGLPLTEPKQETNAAGDTVLTQWFERARFEWHAGNPDAYKVLLGLLGAEVRAGGPPDPVSARIRPARCGVVGTVFSFDVFGFTPNEEVGFWITNPAGATVGTRQTTLCLNLLDAGLSFGWQIRVTGITISGGVRHRLRLDLHRNAKLPAQCAERFPDPMTTRRFRFKHRPGPGRWTKIFVECWNRQGCGKIAFIVLEDDGEGAESAFLGLNQIRQEFERGHIFLEFIAIRIGDKDGPSNITDDGRCGGGIVQRHATNGNQLEWHWRSSMSGYAHVEGEDVRIARALGEHRV